MSEESIQLVEFTIEDTNKFKSDLEEKMSLMWRAIEDLKQKVTEEKELLRRERSENERMIKEHVFLRRQLSSFHLPHCPVLTNSECPVHSRSSSGTLERKDADSIFHCDHFTKRFNSEPNFDEDQGQITNTERSDFKMKNFEVMLQELKSGFQIYNDNLFDGTPPILSLSTSPVTSLVTPTKEVSYSKLDHDKSFNDCFSGDWVEGRSEISNQPPSPLGHPEGSRTEIGDEQTKLLDTTLYKTD